MAGWQAAVRSLWGGWVASSEQLGSKVDDLLVSVPEPSEEAGPDSRMQGGAPNLTPCSTTSMMTLIDAAAAGARLAFQWTHMLTFMQK